MPVFSVIIFSLIFRENHEGDGNGKVALFSAEASFVLLGRVGSAEAGEREKDSARGTPVVPSAPSFSPIHLPLR